jgi:hypothetical protein
MNPVAEMLYKSVPALLIVIALFASGWMVRGWSDAEENRQQEAAIAEKRIAIESMSKEVIVQLKDALDNIEKQGIKERLVIQKETEKPIYKQQCFEQSGVDAINEMAKGNKK